MLQWCRTSLRIWSRWSIKRIKVIYHSIHCITVTEEYSCTTFFFFFFSSWSLYFSFKSGEEKKEKKKVKIYTNYSLLLCVGLDATVRIQCDDWTFEVNFLALQCSKISCVFSVVIADSSASLVFWWVFFCCVLFYIYTHFCMQGECHMHSEVNAMCIKRDTITNSWKYFQVYAVRRFLVISLGIFSWKINQSFEYYLFHLKRWKLYVEGENSHLHVTSTHMHTLF